MKQSEQHFRTVLKPLFGVLEHIVRTGFRLYFEGCRDVLYKHAPRTKSSAINDEIVACANALLASSGVQSRSVMQRKLFEFGDVCMFHFKKLDRRKLPSNYPTLFALDFNKQAELPELFSSLPRLIVGYILNRERTEIESVHIVCPAGESLEWSIDLTFENLSTATETKPIELPETSKDAKFSNGKKQRIKRSDTSASASAES